MSTCLNHDQLILNFGLLAWPVAGHIVPIIPTCLSTPVYMVPSRLTSSYMQLHVHGIVYMYMYMYHACRVLDTVLLIRMTNCLNLPHNYITQPSCHTLLIKSPMFEHSYCVVSWLSAVCPSQLGSCWRKTEAISGSCVCVWSKWLADGWGSLAWWLFCWTSNGDLLYALFEEEKSSCVLTGHRLQHNLGVGGIH